MAMTERTRRVVIILVIVLVAGIVMCLVCGTFGAFQGSRWIDDMMEQGRRTVTEADDFAASHDQQACLEEGLHRSDGCEAMTMSCLTQVSVFLNRCLDVATPTPGFCDGVPPQTEIMQSATWAIAECGRLHRESDPRCRNVVQVVQQACARQGMPSRAH